MKSMGLSFLEKRTEPRSDGKGVNKSTKHKKHMKTMFRHLFTTYEAQFFVKKCLK